MNEINEQWSEPRRPIFDSNKKNNIYAGELMKQLNRPGMVKQYHLL